MKFLHKINQIYLLSFVITLILLSILGYYVLHFLIVESAKEKLIEKENQIIEQIKNDSIVPNFYPYIVISKNLKTVNQEGTFKTIYIENMLEDDELEPYLEYSTIAKVNNNIYSIKIRQSILENEELIMTIAISLLIILILVQSLIFIINKSLTKKVWGRFEYNLNELSNYSFEKKNTLQLQATDIKEFDHLNKILLDLTAKLSRDYVAIKEFADNASHELQTPLAIITMNLEALLQEKLSKKLTEKIYVSFQYANKLNKLNKSLLLLTKIDNGQFKNAIPVNLSKELKEKIKLFNPLIKAQNIQLKSNLDLDFMVNMDPILADTLINNLLSNAINHNLEEGFINISVEKDKLSVSNSTLKTSLKEEELFERFKKGNASVNSEGLGLGLAIVKKVVDLYGLNIYLKHNSNIMIVTLSR